MSGRAVATTRMTDALLRGTGGEKATLRMPGLAVAGDPEEQVGLAEPTFQDYVIEPVTYRKIRPRVGFSGDVAAGYEMLVSASAVSGLVGSLEYESAQVLFRDAFGVLMGEVLMRVESCSAVMVSGGVVMYRLLLQTPLDVVV